MRINKAEFADSNSAVIRIPEDVQIIAEESFCNTAAAVIVIPNGCQKIESRSFAGNSALRWIVIPSSVQQIAEDAFEGCGTYGIYTSLNSAACSYAITHGIEYRLGAE